MKPYDQFMDYLYYPDIINALKIIIPKQEKFKSKSIIVFMLVIFQELI